MTPEDKKLLLKDLCTRLPYGVKIHINSCIEEQNQMHLFDVNLEFETIGVENEKWAFRAIPIIDDEDETKVVRPYLRPMSSMTEAELKEFISITENVLVVGEKLSTVILSNDATDWLNAHHFDYRGLIEKGLALEAKEGMYKTE